MHLRSVVKRFTTRCRCNYSSAWDESERRGFFYSLGFFSSIIRFPLSLSLSPADIFDKEIFFFFFPSPRFVASSMRIRLVRFNLSIVKFQLLLSSRRFDDDRRGIMFEHLINENRRRRLLSLSFSAPFFSRSHGRSKPRGRIVFNQHG